MSLKTNSIVCRQLISAVFLLVLLSTGQIFAQGAFTWMKGENNTGSYGNITMAYVPPTAHSPGARYGGATWTDNNNGRMWLFGGFGYGQSNGGYQSDLWRLDPGTGLWTYMGGPLNSGNTGNYGTKGVESAANWPRARFQATTWVDPSGNYWMFGGFGFDSSGTTGVLSDLWRFNTNTGYWTWVGGSHLIAAKGNLRGPQSSWMPGARHYAAGFIQGNSIYLYGGHGTDTAGSYGLLNDMWRYDLVTGNWTNIYLSAISENGNYGTQGVAAPTNHPGARRMMVVKQNGNLVYLFGGTGYSSSGFSATLNDLWSYDLTTGFWTWLKGSQSGDTYGFYGSIRIEAPGNGPGSRIASGGWMDDNGYLWIYGGNGYSNASNGILRDLWRYNPATNNWAWMQGDYTLNASADYGIMDLGTPLTKPGSKYDYHTFKDAHGNFVMFGGIGVGKIGGPGHMSDLWKFEPSTLTWTWINGDQTTTVNTRYSAYTPSTNERPASRQHAASFTTTDGSFWLYGGYSPSGLMSDLYRFEPSTNKWALVKGAPSGGQMASYQMKGVPGTSNIPGGRYQMAYWSDQRGNIWICGGEGYTTSSGGWLNDVWMYNPKLNEWTWVAGDMSVNPQGVYGSQYVPAPTNTPGGRTGAAAAYVSSSEKVYLFGGNSFNPSGGNGYMNDLWEFDIRSYVWTWLKGATTHGQSGNYASKGSFSATTYPGCRAVASAFSPGDGRLWFYGGYSYSGYLGDLWAYDPTSHYFGWMSGDAGYNTAPVYGYQGVPAPTSTPGARGSLCSWMGANNNLYLFGGQSNSGLYNDIWSYDFLAKNWTWINGRNGTNAAGVYGTMGISQSANQPGARYGAVQFQERYGNLWIFGGNGYTPYGTGMLNDLWKYEPDGEVTILSNNVPELICINETGTLTLSLVTMATTKGNYEVRIYDGRPMGDPAANLVATSPVTYLGAGNITNIIYPISRSLLTHNGDPAYEGHRYYVYVVSQNLPNTINAQAPDIMIAALATAEAGSNQTIAASATAQLNGSIGGSATSGTWTTSGDGVFNNASSLNAIYTPGSNDVISGSVTLRLTSNDPSGPCNSVYDEMTLSIQNSVNISVVGRTADTTICLNEFDPMTYGVRITTDVTGTYSLYGYEFGLMGEPAANLCLRSPSYQVNAGDSGWVTITFDKWYLTNFGNPAYANKHYYLYVVSDNQVAESAVRIMDIVIYPTPAMPTLACSDSDFTYCTGTAVTFAAAGGQALDTFAFQVNGSVLQRGTGTTFAPLSLNDQDAVSVILIERNTGCVVSSASVPVTVGSGPTVAIGTTSTLTDPLGSNGGQLLCTGNVLFTNSSSVPSGTLTYYWNFGDGSPVVSTTSTEPIKHEYAVNNGINWFDPAFPNSRYSIGMTAVSNAGCTATTSIVRDVKNGPEAVIGLSSAASQALNGNSFTLSNGSLNHHPSFITNSLWNFGEGTTSTATYLNPKSYAASGTYPVSLIVYSNTGCTDTATIELTVTPGSGGGGGGTPCAAVVGFYVWSNAVSQPLSTNRFDFFNTTQHNGFGWITLYQWDFGDGTTSTNTFVYGKQYAAAGTYTVTLTATSSTGCTSTYSMDVTVTPSAAASYTYVPNACGNKTVAFTNTSQNASSYIWNFGDGNYGFTENPSHTYAADGNYTVTLTVNGGAASNVQTIDVVSNPSAGSITSQLNSCANQYTFTSTATGTNLSYAWTFSGGTGQVSTGATVQRSYADAGSQTVDLLVTAGGRCSTQVSTLTLDVVPGGGSSLVPGFTWTMVNDGACNTGIRFTNTSSGSSYVEYNFGDGTRSTPSSTSTLFHSYASTGTFVVTQTAYATGGCSANYTATVVVTATGYPTPESSFSTDMATQCITNNRFDFFNRTQLNGWGWVPKYYWDFGDGTQDNVNTFTYGKHYATPGDYQVRLVAESNFGCRDTSYLTVHVLPLSSCTPGLIRMNENEKPGVMGNDNGSLNNALASGFQQIGSVENKISVFPNPTSDLSTLDLSAFRQQNVTVCILDMTGRLVWQITLDVLRDQYLNLPSSEWGNGTYLVTAESKNGVVAHTRLLIAR